MSTGAGHSQLQPAGEAAEASGTRSLARPAASSAAHQGSSSITRAAAASKHASSTSSSPTPATTSQQEEPPAAAAAPAAALSEETPQGSGATVEPAQQHIAALSLSEVSTAAAPRSIGTAALHTVAGTAYQEEAGVASRARAELKPPAVTAADVSTPFAAAAAQAEVPLALLATEPVLAPTQGSPAIAALPHASSALPFAPSAASMLSEAQLGMPHVPSMGPGGLAAVIAAAANAPQLLRAPTGSSSGGSSGRRGREGSSVGALREVPSQALPEQVEEEPAVAAAGAAEAVPS